MAHADILIIGDSIAKGYLSHDPAIDLVAVAGTDYYGKSHNNQAVPSTASAYGVTNISAWLSTYTPNYVFDEYGINDIRMRPDATTVNNWLNNKATIRSAVIASGASYICCALLPESYDINYTPYPDNRSWIKLANHSLTEWCARNNILCAEPYQYFCYTTPGSNDDSVNTSIFNADLIHPNESGTTLMAQLWAKPRVPDFTVYNGDGSYKMSNHESWSWFVLSTGASISGDANTGTLVIPTGETADSPVKAIKNLTSKNITVITISPVVTSGSNEIWYRTANTNFARNDSTITWKQYTTPFKTNDFFLQYRLKGL